MDKTRIRAEILKGKEIALEKPENLHPLANFLWDKTIVSVQSLPLPIAHESFDNLDLENSINALIDRFNDETVTQQTLYTIFIHELIHKYA